MASEKVAELKALSDEALVHQEMTWQDQLMGDMLRLRLNKLVNTSTLGKTRRNIARAQTILTTRERDTNAPKGSLKAKHRSTWQRPAPAAADGGAGEGFLKNLLDGNA